MRCDSGASGALPATVALVAPSADNGRPNHGGGGTSLSTSRGTSSKSATGSSDGNENIVYGGGAAAIAALHGSGCAGGIAAAACGVAAADGSKSKLGIFGADDEQEVVGGGSIRAIHGTHDGITIAADGVVSADVRACDTDPALCGCSDAGGVVDDCHDDTAGVADRLGALDALPRPVLASVLCRLDTRCALRAAAACAALRGLVDGDVLPHMCDLDLTGVEGPAMAAALEWLGNCGVVAGGGRLRSLAIQGAAAHSAVGPLLTSPHGPRSLAGLTRLSLTAWRRLDDERLAELLRHTPRLRELEFTDCSVGDAGLAAIASLCPLLESLDCSHCRGVGDDGVAALARGCSRLASLKLDGCIHITHRAAAALRAHCRMLSHLSLARCFRIGSTAVRALVAPRQGAGGRARPSFSAAGAPPPPLRSLSLCMCPRVGDVEALGQLSTLEELDLTGCAAVDGRQLRRALEGSAKTMHTLRLNNCVGLDGASLVAAVAACTSLVALSTRGLALKDDDVWGLARHTSGLRELNISWASQVTDAGLAPLLAANPHLEVLELEGLYRLTDNTAEQVAACCPRVRTLNVRMVNLLSVGALRALVLGPDGRPSRRAGADGGEGGAGLNGVPACNASAPCVLARTSASHVEGRLRRNGGTEARLGRGGEACGGVKKEAAGCEGGDLRPCRDDDDGAVGVGTGAAAALCSGGGRGGGSGGRMGLGAGAPRPGYEDMDDGNCGSGVCDRGLQDLHVLKLGSVLSEEETTSLVRVLKRARPGLVMRV